MLYQDYLAALIAHYRHYDLSGARSVVKIYQDYLLPGAENQSFISEGHTTELGELIADDKALDLDAWVDAKTFLLGFPQRLLAIADKLGNGDNLTHADSQYLYKLRKREQKGLFSG